MDPIRRAYSRLESSWHAPTATDELAIAQARERTVRIIDEVNRVFREDVAQYRAALA